MADEARTLEYAATRRRRWRWRRWVTLVLLIAAAGTCYDYREPIGRRARLLYWQHKCLTYTRPPGTPVATTSPSPNDPDYVVWGNWTGVGYTMLPECWQKFCTERRPSRPSSVTQLAGRGPATLFLHERTSRSGHRRLVRVQTNYGANALEMERFYEVEVIQPGSIWREPKDVGPRKLFQISGRFVLAEVSFAQPDPGDHAHFWFDFTVDDDRTGTTRRGTVDAWLNDDDTVTFKLRDPATTRGL